VLLDKEQGKDNMWTLGSVDHNAGKPAISELGIPAEALAANSMLVRKKAVGSLTVKEIQAELRKRKRMVSGKREILEERLRTAMAQDWVAQHSAKEKPVGPRILPFEFKEYKGNLAELAKLPSFDVLSVDQLKQILKFHREQKEYAQLNIGLAPSKPLLLAELHRLINFERIAKAIQPVAAVRKGRPAKDPAPPPAANIVEGKRQPRPSAAALELIADDGSLSAAVDEDDDLQDICFCKKKGKGAVIECAGPGCKNNRWLHYECLAFTEEDIRYWEKEAPESEPFVCPRCSGESDKPGGEGSSEPEAASASQGDDADDAIDLREEDVAHDLGL